MDFQETCGSKRYSSRIENLYGDSRDTAPALFSICDARHQFQTDFFHTTVPYFFDYYGDLNPNVGLAQCPKYFPHVQERNRVERGEIGGYELARTGQIISITMTLSSSG